MNTPQPDTSTLEGKIAVMKAALEGKRIQCCLSRHVADDSCWASTLKDPNNNAWNWDHLKYRIHPEDLNPPKWRAWSPCDKVLPGLLMRSKIDSRITFLILSVVTDGIYHAIDCGIQFCPWDDLFKYRECSYDNGKTWGPCGVRE